ncbi:MAG: Zn-dependent oxidoreductase, partial [Deltaproteobacteria bacterium]
MKAVVYEEYAPDDDFKRILQVKEIDEPKAKPDQVVFQVKAAGVNYNDIWGMRGTPIPVPLPH